MTDSLGEIVPAETAIGRPMATARRLVEASISANTRRTYAGALGRLDAWLDGRQLEDASLAAYLAVLHDAGRAAASASVTVAAARFRAKLASQPSPAGELTTRLLAGYRRSEVSALRWSDLVDADAGDGILVAVRRSKTKPEGETRDVRFVKDGVARTIYALHDATNPRPGDHVVPLSPQMVGLRFAAAAKAAGLEPRVTAHSGRVGLASELTSRGASTTAVMLAGNWKTSRMVAHYSAGATAERGAVARYL